MHVAIRADGGPDIGYGHLVRTSAVAEVLLERGHSVTYLTSTPGGVRVVDIDAEIREFHSTTEPIEIAVADVDPDVVLIDSYDVNTESQVSFSEHAAATAVVVDDTRFDVCADLVVNGNLYAADLDYGWVGEEPAWCLGPRYLLLRSTMRDFAGRVPPWRNPPERALLTMGGSDVSDTTPTALRGFDGAEFTVHVVVGPGFTNGPEIERVARDIDADVTLHEDPENMASLIFESDLAVAGCGSTTYELLALGTPFVGSVQADNQHPIAEALHEDGLATVIGNTPGVDQFSRAIQELVENVDRRRAYRERGRDLVDGHGAVRVADELEELTE